MDLIPSFAVDHTKIIPGIYISRVDTVGDMDVTTYDIRMKHPNTEPAIAPAAIHTIEHIVATYLRNDETWKDRLIYWGPMGCLTGFYMITKSEYSCEEIRDCMINSMKYVCEYKGDVPGTDVTQCGNHLMHDLPMAKYHCLQYWRKLINEFWCEYPTIKRQNTKEGVKFYDS